MHNHRDGATVCGNSRETDCSYTTNDDILIPGEGNPPQPNKLKQSHYPTWDVEDNIQNQSGNIG
ncbi:hypothetical protein GCM10008915_74480 [Bifidobacterium pullorum subsp. gallinarum]